MDPELTKQMFISSKQAVVDDANEKSYQQINFLEFLEFLCRVGMHCYKSNYVKTYGLDRVELKISKAEAVSQLVDVTFDWLVAHEKQVRAEQIGGAKVKNENKKEGHGREQIKF